MATSKDTGSETLVVQSSNMVSTTGDSQTPSPSLIEDDYYFLSYTSSVTSGTVTPAVGGTNAPVTSASGRYQAVVKAGSGSTLAFSKSGTATISNIHLVQVGQLLHSNTDAGTYVIHFNLLDMEIGDEVMAMVGTKIQSAGDICWMQVGTWAHSQPMTSGKMSIPVSSPHEIIFTLVQLAGTARTIDWEVISL